MEGRKNPQGLVTVSGRWGDQGLEDDSELGLLSQVPGGDRRPTEHGSPGVELGRVSGWSPGLGVLAASSSSMLAQLNPLCGARMERRELGKAAARRRGTDGEPSAAGTAPKGRGDSRTSQDISRLGKSPPPPFLRGEYTQKVHVMEWRGIRAQRLPAAHPAPTLTRGAGHGSRGSLAGRLSSLGRAREGYVSS